ncbi:hypothetical protein VTJ49DRAFT_4458 [Mycothermus thermophilus]|uniref:Urease accessory protein UreD n=1 Tax=Humicola insolens TaxID=85995 RepID=A0ABR3VLB3_HUMIN
MPHKHTRREKDESTFDLPPTQIARPLPPTTISKNKTAAKKAADKKAIDATKKTGQKRKRGAKDPDDAPRAFKRLMALTEGKIPRNNLDNGDAPSSGKGNKKKAKTATTSTTSETPSKEELKIRPGESLAEFNRRVDAALPVSGLAHKMVKNGKDPLGLKVWRTLKERKMHNMYAEWREMDRKIRERREEEQELEEEREMEREMELGVSWKLELEGAEGAGGKKKKNKKKGKRARYIGEEAGPEGDPWEEVKKRRGEGKVGLNDVAQAPPELKLPKKTLIRGATVQVENIPKSAGSLRQREELQNIRESVVASYRKMMAERRPAVGT